MKNIFLLFLCFLAGTIQAQISRTPVLTADAIVQIKLIERDGLDVRGEIVEVIHGNSDLLIKGSTQTFYYGDYFGCGLDQHHPGYEEMIIFLDWGSRGYELIDFDEHFIEVREGVFDLDFYGVSYQMDANYLEKELPLLRKTYRIKHLKLSHKTGVDIEKMKKSSWLIRDLENNHPEVFFSGPVDPIFIEMKEEQLETKPQEKIYELFEVFTQPVYDGGEEQLAIDINEYLEYPRQMVEAEIEGNVYIKFVIHDDRSFSDIRIVRSVYKDLDREAIRVLEMLEGNFEPATLNGNYVNCWYVVPMRFRLNK